jgi:hypothetical protein
LAIYEDLVLDIAARVSHEITENYIKSYQNVNGLGLSVRAEGLAEDLIGIANAELNDLVSADLRLIRRRVAKEGMSFFTKTLPSLGRAVDTALANSQPFVGPSTFGRKSKGSSLPVMFYWLTRRLWDDSGDELHAANAMDVLWLRQLTYAYYKLETPFTEKQLAKACASYVATEREISQVKIPDGDLAIELASNFIARVCAQVDGLDITPAHGPGAVATGEKPWEKNRFPRFYPGLEGIYPYTGYFASCLGEVCDRYHLYPSLEVVERPTAKVVFVPKDSRGPRTISCEPVELQWIQQGIARLLVKEIESNRLTRGHVNFRDQQVNRKLARFGSMGANWVTLDMKDASDRVSLDLVKHLFRKTRLLDCLLASRSVDNLLPDGSRITLSKFAPMGSALCFPVEALVFWALAVGQICETSGFIVKLPNEWWRGNPTLQWACAGVYVYGDDIVVRREDYPSIVQRYESVGLKVNTSKCCTGRFFRESCGMDAYKGDSVTPIKFRTPLCPDK